MQKVILVAGAYALAAFLKFNAFWPSPGFEKDHRTFYWTESAMHMYMASKVAKSEALGDLDKRAQFPEGIELSKDIAPAMPYLTGTLYRLISPAMPLDIFIAYLFLFYSSLTVVAVYLWSNALFAPQKLPAYAATYLYAVSAPAFIRSAGAFIKEDLALPTVLLGFYFLFSAWRSETVRQQRARAIGAAILVSLALLSWHFTQFMLLSFSAILVISVLVNGKFTPAQRNTLGLFTLLIAVISTAFPMLRATAFIVSPAMALLYAILIYHFAGGLQKTRRDALTLAVFTISILIYFKSGLAEQSHVFQLVIDKLRFLLQKPEDPLQLSYATRSVWIEDFNSPGAYFLLYTVSAFLPLGIVGLLLLGKRALTQRSNREALFITVYGTGFLFFFFMVRRMITIDIIFLSMAMGALLTFKKRATAAAAVLLAAVFIFEAWKSYNYNEPNPVNLYFGEAFPARELPQAYTVAEHTDLFNWIKVNTTEDQPILASMGLSPVILAYTNRPIIIHSMFDAKVMRDKVQNYVDALYSTEVKFSEFAQATGAQFFVYESKNLLMNGPNSDRYVAGKMNPGPDTAVFNFQFHPEQLKHFTLVYQNTAYRVYASSQIAPRSQILPQPVYDERILAADNAAQAIGFFQTARQHLMLGFQYGGAGNLPEALRHWEEVKRQAPFTIDIHAHLCLGYLITKNLSEAEANCRRQLELQPHSPVGHYHQALYFEQTANIDKAVEELRIALKIDPRYTKASERLAKLRP